ncbi:TPA: hypothetical protein KD840_004783 [Vibrio parahaemolyticus]|nr:hypothetical protein VV208B2_46570 [Vibrio vulnificus]BDP38533.1 hypothetical protein VA208B3_49040 [Vibrio alginolyticus]HBC3917352.1 hypothetical protein [Vibrio parahaemolyticus]
MVCVEIELDGVVTTKESPYYKTCEGAVDIDEIKNYFARLGYSLGRNLEILRGAELPWDSGINAYNNRVPFNHNPHQVDSWQREQWYRGWLAQDDMDRYTTYDWSTNTFTSLRVQK